MLGMSDHPVTLTPSYQGTINIQLHQVLGVRRHDDGWSGFPLRGL